MKNNIDVLPPVVRDRNATTLMRIHTLERRKRRLKLTTASRQSKSHRRRRSLTPGNFFND